jgi:hypothetical protein
MNEILKHQTWKLKKNVMVAMVVSKKKTTQRLIVVNMGDGTVLLAHQVRIQNTRTGDFGTRYILLKMNCVRDHTA